MGSKVRVGLLYGGKSGEHEVSLQTALAVMGQFNYDKYEIIPFYITKEGQWRSGATLHQPPATIEQIKLAANNDSSSIAMLFQSDASCNNNELQSSTERAYVSSVQTTDDRKVLDVIFPLLHGTYGEDGTVQGMLEMAGVPYVGAGVLASAVGMDKVMMKKVFAIEDLPQCVFRYFNRTQWDKDAPFFIMECEVSLGYPCFIKPANLGSSVGISKANNREELIEAVNFAFRYDRKVIVEEFVDAREIEVSVLGNDEVQASVPGEIVPNNEFYDYKAKYIDGKSAMIIPAELDEATTEQIREMAVRAFQSIDGSGLSRVDFFVGKEDNRIYINEINTMPGFTPFSMYPLLWKESGLSYGELLQKLIDLALERHAEKQRLVYTE
ncbi:D-alanine--D-alanine ligase [Paenibacillus yanchengensis]|uniref:D-alanine--D-alanine ligase n=1 Tax=Paenibacillus yanchengensis TaxID=2035833 RepID=A0ABW4YIR1_9BACL